MQECRTSTTLIVGAAALLRGGGHRRSCNLVAARSRRQRRDARRRASRRPSNHAAHRIVAVHARYVVLEAEGRDLAARQAKPKSERGQGEKDIVDRSDDRRTGQEVVPFGWFGKAKIDPPHSTPAPAGRTSDLTPAQSGTECPSSAFRPTTETLDSGAAVRASRRVAADFGGRRRRRRSSRQPQARARRNARLCVGQKEIERRYGLSDE